MSMLAQSTTQSTSTFRKINKGFRFFLFGTLILCYAFFKTPYHAAFAKTPNKSLNRTANKLERLANHTSNHPNAKARLVTMHVLATHTGFSIDELEKYSGSVTLGHLSKAAVVAHATHQSLDETISQLLSGTSLNQILTQSNTGEQFVRAAIFSTFTALNLSLSHILPSTADNDSDGIPNAWDDDIDGDNIKNADDPDIDGDGTLNNEDTDMDDDGLDNSIDDDIDADGVANSDDSDMDDDGLDNSEDQDDDSDGLEDQDDDDDDSDGVSDDDDPDSDEDSDGDDDSGDDDGSDDDGSDDDGSDDDGSDD
ncbi:MAG TPA: hypothetical protein PLL06_13015, partial [Acidobacteriota bacterium]|nr:hypothetical protein [Acidobacteriota bacterium]